MNTDKVQELKSLRVEGLKGNGALIPRAILGVLCFVCILCLQPGKPVRGQNPVLDGGSVADTVEAIQRARVTTRILYVVAHPDDEGGSAGLFAYLTRHVGADVAILSLTRGEGGQNALGPEIGPRLGVLRTQEFLAATRQYGTRLFFTRAADFGYSKTPEETMKVWGDAALADMMQVMRAFRPHIIINNWAGVRSGHGHHQTSGLWTPRALEELRKTDDPWWKGVVLLNVSRGALPAGAVSIPSDQISPLRGKSYNEIGLAGFVNHRTQGIVGFRGSPFFRGTRSVVPAEGVAFRAAQFEAPLEDLEKRFPEFADRIGTGLSKAGTELDHALEAARSLDWRRATQALGFAGAYIRDADENLNVHPAEKIASVRRELAQIRERVDTALGLAAAVQINAQADRSEIVAGESFTVRVEWQYRRDVPLEVESAALVLPEGWRITKEEKEREGSVRLTVSVPPDAKAPNGSEDWMYPEPPPLVRARLRAKVEGYAFEVEEAVTAMRVTSTRADEVPLALVPAVNISLEPHLFVVLSRQPPRKLELLARVHHYGTAPAEIAAAIETPAGWRASGPEKLQFAGPGDQLVKFALTPSVRPAVGAYELRASARRTADGAEFHTSLEPLPTLPTHLWSEPAAAAVRVLDMTVPANLRVGYIAAANDPIPDVLRQLGIHVELLDEVALAFGDLSRFDAIAVGIRAYELRTDLIRSNQRLLDYAAAGGTLVVQYQREADWNRLKPAPYPATIGQPTVRVADETASVRFLAPEHSILNFPNKIRATDFDGWVQERGLYYWSEFDARYQPILGMNDSGEPETRGGLVYARHGEGYYIYTGLSFFRQLPEGVPGGLRLFVNLLSQGRATAGAKVQGQGVR